MDGPIDICLWPVEEMTAEKARGWFPAWTSETLAQTLDARETANSAARAHAAELPFAKVTTSKGRRRLVNNPTQWEARIARDGPQPGSRDADILERKRKADDRRRDRFIVPRFGSKGSVSTPEEAEAYAPLATNALGGVWFDNMERALRREEVKTSGRKTNVGTIVWLPDECMARIVSPGCSKAIHNMGVNRKGHGHLLYPEEACYLMDTREVVLHRGSVDGRRLSTRDIYGLLIEAGLSVDDYTVFSYLMRCGYVAARHRVLWKEDIVEPEPQARDAEADGSRLPEPFDESSVCRNFKKLRYIDHGNLRASAKLWNGDDVAGDAPQLARNFQIRYDVWLKAGAPFRRRDPGAPDFHLCVYNSRTAPPDLTALSALFLNTGTRPLHMASVDDAGAVLFLHAIQEPLAVREPPPGLVDIPTKKWKQ